MRGPERDGDAACGERALIYLDHHAATPVCAAASAAIEEARADAWANPASVHAAGRAARAHLERARDRIAEALGAAPADVVVTSGGTEACNLGVLGLYRDGAVVTTAIEHPAVARAVDLLERRGAAVTRLAVPAGLPPSVDAFAASFAGGTGLCALQWVNHETGTRLPVAEYAQACKRAGVPFFVDATQALGKLDVNVERLGADAVAVASHKVGGPSGAGALWVRRGAALGGVLVGGAQERGRRPGSPDVLAVVGFGAACEVLATRLAAQPLVAKLRDEVERAAEALGGTPNAIEAPRVATVTNLSFRGVRGEDLVAALDVEGVCAASGAACSSGLAEPSPVLRAMYPAEGWRAGAALRLSFGPETTEIESKKAIEALSRVAHRLRS